jgi:stage II sporulation protein D
MSIKRKLVLIGICVGIILVVFTVNVVRRLQNEKKGDSGQDSVVENVITRAEAFRLLSYLEYDKSHREAIPLGITYTDKQMSDWYDTYVNAAWKMGLIEEKISVSPKEALTYRACKDLIDKLILKNPDYQSVYTGLSFDFTKAEEKMLIPDFLELYEAILSAIPSEDRLLKKATLFVLGKDVTEDGKDRMVTDQGKYYYQNAKSYITFYEELQQKLMKDQEQGIGDTTAVTDTPKEKEASEASENTAANIIDQYLDKGINAMVCGQELIYITSVTTEKMVIHNVWIKQGEGTLVDTYINGLDKSFDTITQFTSPIEKVIGDITVENQKVVKIYVKPDMIQGKVLRSGKDYIEIEGYGKVPLDENYKIYKIYGELSIEPTGSILVGYENTDFIVSDGKISAALITESIKAENIRVLLKTTDFKDIYHDKVELTSADDFTISSKQIEKSYKGGDVVTIEPGDELLSGGRITVKTSSENSKIEISSIKRSYGTPKYRGSIEIAEDNSKLMIINELPLEEYLYAVIPSEMPTVYGTEALKVQAVCARSYAYKHLMANSLSGYGAHVDDSVSYQVYNNVAENEDSILAVKDTYGKVIEYDGEVITAYYFSTSCGHTTKPSTVWGNDVSMPYLEGKLMLVEADGEGDEAQSDAAELYEDLSTEEKFRSFIEAKDVTTYDSGFNWYRWKVTMNIKDIKKVIDSCLLRRYNANPDLILTMTSEAKEGKEAVFESIPVETVGDIVDISVLKRDQSGIVTELLITGSENTIRVRTEYNIRAFLAPTYDSLVRLDESKIDNLSLLPSAFFILDKVESKGKLAGYTLSGGGYGHGVGMSQNGVKGLVDAGKNYEEIVAYFYEGTEMGFIYE